MPILLFRRASSWGVLWLLAASATADDWPFFRGPNYNGTSAETGWTAEWPAVGPKVAWKVDVGIGASSVVVASDRVFTMGSRGDRDQDVVRCLDTASGRELWRVAYPCKFDARQVEGGPASTPTAKTSAISCSAPANVSTAWPVNSSFSVWRKPGMRICS